MLHLLAVSLLVLLSLEGKDAQIRDTVSVQVAWNNSGSPAIEGNIKKMVLLCVFLSVHKETWTPWCHLHPVHVTTVSSYSEPQQQHLLSAFIVS